MILVNRVFELNMSFILEWWCACLRLSAPTGFYLIIQTFDSQQGIQESLQYFQFSSINHWALLVQICRPTRHARGSHTWQGGDGAQDCEMQPGGSARLAWDWRNILFSFQVTSLGGNRVRVLPASDLGLGWAAIRSILKNFSLGQSNISRNHMMAVNQFFNVLLRQYLSFQRSFFLSVSLFFSCRSQGHSTTSWLVQ